MNNNEDIKGKQKSHNHSPLKHVVHMALCCGLPIVLIGSLPLIARYSPGLGGMLGKIAPFLCPIMMVMMFIMMSRQNNKGNCCDDKNEKHDGNKPLELNNTIE